MELFNELADEVEYNWRQAGYDHREFPRLASEALAQARLHERVKLWDILQWVGRATELPEQRDLPAGFSNLPVTLVNRPRFYIDLYLWLDGTTTIHQHSFSGAFQVLEGSSLHSRYRFDERQQINEHFRLGEVVFESSELLRQGAIRQIEPGNSFAHSLFHLARPSATITVRTFQDVTHLPQLNYLKPSIAVNPFFSDQWTTKRVQSVSLMLNTQHPDADLVIRECLSRADAHTTFLLLAEVDRWARQPSLRQRFEPEAINHRASELFDFSRSIHGVLIDEFEKAFAEQNWAAEIIKRRGQVTHDDLRFFLALLLNLPDRKEITQLVWAYVPQVDPLQRIMEWIEDLGRMRDPWSTEPNVLGLTEWDESYVLMTELMLAGKSFPELLAAVKEEWPDQKDAAEEWTAKVCAEMRGSSLRNLLFNKEGSKS